MDRTGLIVVVLCVLAFFALQIEIGRLYPPPAHQSATAVGKSTDTSPAPLPSATNDAALAAAPTISEAPAPASSAPVAPALPEKLNFLENDYLKVTFTAQGASIKQVTLKKHKNGPDGNIVLNEHSQANIMALSGWTGAETSSFSVESAPQSLTYTTTLANGVKLTRNYQLGAEYALTVKDTLTNPAAAEAVLPSYTLSVGRAEPLLVRGRYLPISNMYIGAGWLTTDKFHLTTVSEFSPGSWFSSRPARDLVNSTTIDHNPLRWLAVEDQFFAVLLTPTPDHLIPDAIFRCLNQRDANGSLAPQIEPDIEAFAHFPEVHVPAGQTVNLTYSLYMGPKEYTRLNALGENQGELMNYDGVLPFSLIIVPLLTVLHFFYNLVGNYGVAIILLTLCVKGITWPLQSFANRSGKRMQALAPKIKELQAKYKEQPEKLNTETFALYREFGVNPFGGCLPALVQMPIFFSLYFMLQNAVELRGQSFLWVHDLTQSDTVWSYNLPFVIPFLNTSHLALNPLPLMVTGLTMVMMRMTPQIGDPQQAKIAQIMPLFFLFFFYNFAAGLSLYYVINNCVSIVQIYRNLRKPLPDLKRKPRQSAGPAMPGRA